MLVKDTFFNFPGKQIIGLLLDIENMGIIPSFFVMLKITVKTQIGVGLKGGTFSDKMSILTTDK